MPRSGEWVNVEMKGETFYFPSFQPVIWENQTTGQKADDGKPRIELLDASFIEEVSKVLTFGAKKYADHNWRKGLAVSRLLGASLRHIFAVLRGEDKDQETGLHHLAHAGCEIMFAYWMLTNKPELDDRWKK